MKLLFVVVIGKLSCKSSGRGEEARHCSLRLPASLFMFEQDVGEDKQSRMEELKQQVAEAVDKLYDRALEEAVRKRTALEESVATSEQRLRESLGPDAAQAIAPKALPLQERQEHNLARLQELDSVSLPAYSPHPSP
eukprot:jgi/Mesen1/4664/ME000241S03705